MMNILEEPSAAKSLIAGAAAGAAGALAMGLFERLLMKRRSQASADHHQRGRGKPPTTKAAEKIAGKLSRDAGRAADPLMHYAMGVFAGAMFGLAAERTDKVTAAAGLPYGVSIWLTADEMAAPALKLAPSPEKTSLRGHLESLVGHLIFGATVNAVHRILRRTLLK
jgi:hypothetical protein